MDSDGVAASFPVSIESQRYLLVSFRVEGTTVPAGAHTMNGTVLSSTGEEQFVLDLLVTPAALRVIALPSVIPQAIMRAGETGYQSFCTIYNVDQNAIKWHIRNCTTTDPAALDPPMVTFSDCGGNASWIDLASETSAVVSFAAPRLVGRRNY